MASPDPLPLADMPSDLAADRLAVGHATATDWAQVAQWAADEGWNPGLGDSACFLAQDQAGFFVGRLGSEVVSAISVVNHDPGFAFVGHYLVAPDRRGQGLGIATWRAALPHAGDRVIGLDAVPAQQDNYRRSGFRPAYRTARYAGLARPNGRQTPSGTLPAAGHANAIRAYDRRCCPAERPEFVTRWIGAPGHVARVRVRGGRLAGYGVIRPSQDGFRIGPLFADTPADAEALFDALAAEAGEARIAIDVPEPNEAARALVEARGLTPGFETLRMYTGPTRPVAADRVYGVASLELG